MDCSPPGSSIHGIFQARILEWVAISFFRRSSQSRSNWRLLHILHWQAGHVLLAPPGKPTVNHAAVFEPSWRWWRGIQESQRGEWEDWTYSLNRPCWGQCDSGLKQGKIRQENRWKATTLPKWDHDKVLAFSSGSRNGVKGKFQRHQGWTGGDLGNHWT